MTKIVAIGFDIVRTHSSLHHCFRVVRNDSFRDVEVLLDRNLCMIVCEVHRLKCPLSVLVGSLLNTWSSQFEFFQCSVLEVARVGSFFEIGVEHSWWLSAISAVLTASHVCSYSLFVAYVAVISGVLRSWGGEIAPFRSIASARAAVYSQSSNPTESLGAS